MALMCPITSTVRGWPFEVSLEGAREVDGAALTDQVKSLDWRKRPFCSRRTGLGAKEAKMPSTGWKGNFC